YCVCDHLRAQHISLKEMMVVVDRTRHMRLSREVHDDVGFTDQRVDKRCIADVAVPELQPAVIDLAKADGQVLDTSSVGQEVEHEDAVVRVVLVDMPD